jgi:uncharacterized protein (TIGR03663 family)
MNPQPPVTRMRTAGTSSADAGALADFPMLRDQIETWKNVLAQTDWTPWLIIGLAALLRFFLLGIKPPHFDEGINGWFVDTSIVKNGFYKYDPTNYHGPLHFYVLFLSQTLFGRNLWALRLPVVLVSVTCVWLTLKFEPFVGKTVARMAALAMAVSPGFVFYGRYSIHEVWIVLFTMLFIFGLLGLWKFGTPNYLWCAGMGVTGMVLSKETYIIHVGCAVIAAGLCTISNSLSPMPDARRAKPTWDYVDLGMVVATGIVLLIFFYSGTFFHWNGVKGLYKAYSAWFATGHEGHGHEKPWYYWLKIMAPSFRLGRADFFGYELPTLAGLVLCLFSLRLKNFSLRYLAIYGVGTLIVYSYVHYKTPWCIISFIWPFLFIFGAALLVIHLRYKKATYVISAILLCVSFGSTIWLNYFRCTTETEPYVYVQTYNDIYRLTNPLLNLAKRNPLAYQLTGHIIRGSAYPLPWMLGDFTHIGYYERDNLPAKFDADFLLVQQDKIATVEAKMHDSYFTEPLTIRPYQDPSKAYFNAKIFKPLFPGRAPDFIGKATADEQSTSQ